MKKIVVYWSGTGNTQEIAEKIANDLNVSAFSVSQITPQDALENDLIIFGCPAMGNEELEDSEFLPFYQEVLSQIGDKKVALFGSYGWGDGEWMRNWEQEVGQNLVTNGLIVNGGLAELDLASYDEFISKLN